MAGPGHDPRNEAGQPPRAANPNPGGGVGGDHGSNGPPAVVKDLFGSYESSVESDTGRVWREGGREALEDWFEEENPTVRTKAQRGMHDPNRTKLQNVMDSLYWQALEGGITPAKHLLDLRVGKPVAQTETKVGGLEDGVEFGKQAAGLVSGIEAQLKEAGVDTSLIEQAAEDYIFSNDRAEESPLDDQEA